MTQCTGLQLLPLCADCGDKSCVLERSDAVPPVICSSDAIRSKAHKPDVRPR